MGRSAIMSVRITGNSDDAVKALQKVTGKAAAFGTFMGGAALKGVSALWDTLKGFTGAVMDMSDSTDKFKSTMNFAGFDTSAVEAATKATRDYADKTVYDLSTVQNTTAQLAANGIQDYVGLTEAAGNLNAVAGGNADTFKSVAMVMTQTAGAGKLTTENWNQLTDAIPGAAGKLQQAMQDAGAYTGNFREAMEKGEITADEFNKAIMDLGMTDVAKEAATSTQTMEGALGNLEAAVTGGLTDAFNLVKPAVTDAIGGAAEAVGTFATDATNNIKAFAGALQDTGAFQTAKDMADAVGTALGALGKAFGDVAETIAPGLQGLGDAAGIGTSVGDAFNGAAGVVKAVADKLTEFGDWVSANAEPIAGALVAIGGGFAAFKVAGVISAVASALQGFSVASTAASVAQWALNVAMNANPVMIVVTAIGALVAALVWFFTQTETGRQIWSSFTSWLGSCVNNIVGFFKALPGKIGAFFSQAAQFATDKWNAVVDWFKGLPGRITGAIGNVGNLLYDAGASIISGFLDGLKSMWDSVTGWISGIGDWITEHKGPPEYDAVMLVNNGRLIMQGFARGLRSGFDTDVRRTISRINGQMGGLSLDARASAGGGAAGTVVNVTFNAPVDREGVAREIRKILADYDRKRR
ncbi:tape measure protein [Bifidobacterium felsineum]|uniref:tape measure protein n=1 Tax=Bifidobacterium felsineum TaxID=2045440 RepID=UPI001BDD4660|nr:tape measure protein [Bifidobacterium felsineum]MBT1164027.1 tape measure protein [Bifidobacterium felsineum]